MSIFSSHPFVYLDVETTGLSPWFGDRICEVAVIRCEGEQVVGQYDSLLNPQRPLSPGAARVNGLKDSDLKKAPRFAEVAERVLSLVRDAVIVCHNVPFDLGFLSSELGRMHTQLPTVLTLDTLDIARRYFDFDSNSLQSIARRLDIAVTGAHRALDDVFTTREVLKYFAGRLRSSDIELVLSPYHPPAVTAPELALPPVIEEALQGKKRILIRYVDGRGNASERWVSPKQVLVLRDYLYMVAHCHLRDEERHFRLDRIEQMTIERSDPNENLKSTHPPKSQGMARLAGKTPRP